ncbi:hypothetical protein BC833DRAFT_651635 [Globomyces pollinis-pini]|nr:hypothetical protein BC833DRAFT_651635 [Globomyces pollinis-pini]
MGKNNVVDTWRNKIKKGRSAFTDSWKTATINALNSAGVIAVHGALNKKDTEILKITGFSLKYLPTNDPKLPQVKKSTISVVSLQQMILQELESRIKNVVGEDYELGPSLSYLYSPLDHRTTHQGIHADSATGDPYHGLVVLSNQCTPTIFEMRKELHEPLTGLLTVSNANGQLVDQNTRQKLEHNFAPMLGPVTTLENNMHPISNKPLNAGTVVLFRSDMIHRGPPSNINEDRALLFFTVNKTKRPKMNTQLHPALLGELLYGRGTQQQFELMKRHEESTIKVEPERYDHLSKETKKKYDKWFSKQNSDLNL